MPHGLWHIWQMRASFFSRYTPTVASLLLFKGMAKTWCLGDAAMHGLEARCELESMRGAHPAQCASSVSVP